MEPATRLDYNHQLSLKELPYIVRWSDHRCTRCGRCTAVCPVKAIEPTVRVRRTVYSEGRRSRLRNRLERLTRLLNRSLMLKDIAQDAESGVVTFVDNAVYTATGTIKLKATFTNKNRQLWPGQFGQVAMTLSVMPNVIVVPSQAIQTGQKGPYVFVVKQDLTAESRPVITGLTSDLETVIEQGLQAGERVVTDGHMRLFPGAAVVIRTAASGETKQ